MSLTATFDAANSRVQLALSDLPVIPGLQVFVERQVAGEGWTPVRGAFPFHPTSSTAQFDDYEFVPNVQNDYRARGPAVYDDFGRVTVAGWGVTTSGDTWVTTEGTAADFSTDGADAQVVMNTVGSGYTQTVDTVSRDVDVLFDASFDAVGDVSDVSAYAVTRRIDNSNYYIGGIEAQPDNDWFLLVQKRVGGVLTLVAFVLFSGSFQAGTVYRVRFRTDQSLLQAKVWIPSVEDEPGNWQISEFDTSLPTGDDIGLRSISFAGNTNVVTATFDNYIATDIADLNPTFTDLGTDSITPMQTGVWLKSPFRPFLNREVTLCNWSDEVENARGAVFPILGRRLPIAITDLRDSREFSILLKAADATEADAIRFALSFGDVMFLQTPGPIVECGLARRSYPESLYAFLPQVTTARPVNGSPTYTLTVSMKEVDAPDFGIAGSGSTWNGIVAAFATWNDVVAQFPTWIDVVQFVSDPDDEVVS